MDLLTTYQQKALNFHKHISLTANAGSGKTFVLSRRYIEIALSEKGSLRKIAAITFTDKAAGELYKKIAEHIENWFNTSDNVEEKKLLSGIRRQLVSANISTIHSFCIDILKQFPVEAGLDANFQPIDELTSDDLIELSIEEAIKESLTGGDHSEEIKYLIRFFRSKYSLASQLRSLIKERKKVYELQDKIYNKNEGQIADFFYNAFIETAGAIIQINHGEFISALTVLNEAVLSEKNDNDRALELRELFKDFESSKSVEKKIEIIHLINDSAFTKSGEIRKAGYLTGSLREGLSREILISEKYAGELSYLNIQENHRETELELARFGKSLLNMFTLVVKKYESKKKGNSYLDYDDILILTKNLLKIEGVRSELSRRFRYIMVDEYQDTNDIQYKIFLPILDDLREGNLFVVGDEKQSIYMFRDAELEVFRITKEKIGSTSGEKFLLSLPDSFRMAPGICLFVNNLFRNLFSHPVALFNEVNHSDLVCAKQSNTESLIEILIGAPGSNEPDDQKDEQSEAELVAGRIISLVNGIGISEKLNWKDIAVLVRKRKSFSSLEKIFIENNIPFNIVGGKGFYQRQSIYDIYNYFSFLLDTKNDASLAGIIRSPFFNFSDSRTYELSLEKGETLWEKINNCTRKDDKIKRLIEVLKANIKYTAVYDAPKLLRKILSGSPYLSALAQRASGLQETANISKLVKLTIDFQRKGFKTLYDYVNFLRESIVGTEDEAQAAVADESDSVKVMTLHQAKGLEFPVVFIFNAHEVTLSDKVKKGSVQVDKNFGLLSKVPSNNDYFSDYKSAPISSVFDFISLKKETAELKRLFYVGTTRAKNYLLISAPHLEKYKPNSFMALLQEGLNIDFSEKSFHIRGELQFLKTEENRFVCSSEILENEIKIVRSRGDIKSIVSEVPEKNRIEKVFLSPVTDSPKGEIISATRFAVYRQCPLKYSLTFEMGISGLISDYRKSPLDKITANTKDFDFNFKELTPEDQVKKKTLLPAELKGSIIHSILQKYDAVISPEEIVNIIKDQHGIEDVKTLNDLQVEISGKLNILLDSDIYKRISSYKKSYNEYEIYLSEEDYFLHGIIDKLIIDDGKAIIIDYKTDFVQRDKIYDRSSLYFPQLKFYSYIVNCFFKELTSFELRLIFINFPGMEIQKVLSKNEVAKFGAEIREMIRQIRLREFDQNLLHCIDCVYALNNSKCIVERV